MKFNSQTWPRVFWLVVLVLVQQVSVYASCAIVSVEEMKIYARQDAHNVFYKGFFLGVSGILFFVSLFWLLRKKHYLWFAGIVLVTLLAQLVFGFAEIMAGECGNGGLDARYYAYQLGAISAFILFQFLRLDRSRRNVNLRIT